MGTNMKLSFVTLL